MAMKYEKQDNPPLTQEEKEALYAANAYAFPPPPVPCNRWDRDAWIRYIDSCGKWFTKGAKP